MAGETTKNPEEMWEQAQKILDRERWRGYMSGKLEGALNVLYLMDLDKERRIELLQEAAGLSRATAFDYIEPREIEERINKSAELTYEEKDSLKKLLSNKAMLDDKVIDHPKETMEFVSAMSDSKILEECIPQVDEWVKNGEDVTMRKIRSWIIERYSLL